jgi:DNA-binding MarR family transcriptional regulator
MVISTIHSTNDSSREVLFRTVLNAERPPEELAEFTGFLLNWLGTRSRRAFVSALEPLGFHPREYGVMHVVGARPGITQEELAAQSNVDRTSIVALLDQLEERGVAERRVHPKDRRKRCIFLTEEGARTLEKLRAIALDVGEEMFAPLNAREREQLSALLRKLAGV